jgi:cytochrome b6-f complex iron-sulfur subunit
MENEGKSRRSFLFKMIIGVGALVSSILGIGTFQFASHSFAKSQKRQFGEDVLLKLRPDDPMHIADAGVWVTRVSSQADPVIVDDKCTHLGCRFKWNPDKKLFECPCHLSEFDVNGRVLKGPATRSLQRFEIGQPENGIVSLKNYKSS